MAPPRAPAAGGDGGQGALVWGRSPRGRPWPTSAPPRFASVLLGGPCNLRCPHCVGRQDPARPRVDTLGRYPLAGQGELVRLLRRDAVRQVTLTGLDTDPLLYRRPRALVAALRRAVPGVRLNLHTNGLLLLRRLAVVHLFDRVCVSLPSLEPGTCRAMTGSARVLDLAAISRRVQIPLKVSVLVTRHNRAEVPRLLGRCRRLGITRAVLRRLRGVAGAPPLGAELLPPGARPAGSFAGNPVYRILDAQGRGPAQEVTLWDFQRAALSCLNLMPDGTVNHDYLLSPGRGARNPARKEGPKINAQHTVIKRESADAEPPSAAPRGGGCGRPLQPRSPHTVCGA